MEKQYFQTKEGDITNFEIMIKKPYAKKLFKKKFKVINISSRIFDEVIKWQDYRKIRLKEEYDDVIVFEIKGNGEELSRKEIYIDTCYYDIFIDISENVEFYANITDPSFPVVVKLNEEIIGYIMEMIIERDD